MALIQLFRLEHRTKCTGVYVTHETYDIFCDYYGGTAATSRHPAPYSDSKFVESQEEKGLSGDLNSGLCRFGFKSIDQLRAWFYSDESLIEFGERDIVLRVYNCDESSVIIGSTQCAFEHLFHHESCIAATYELKTLVENHFDLARIS